MRKITEFILFVAVAFNLLLSGCKKEDTPNTSFPELNQIIIKTIPENSAFMVDVNSPVKIVINKNLGMQHSNDFGNWTLTDYIIVTNSDNSISFNKNLIVGEEYDTLILEFNEPLPLQSDIDVSISINWNSSDAISYPEETNVEDLDFTFSTINAAQDLEVVEYIYPEPGNEESNVFAIPTVKFNMPFNTELNNGSSIYKVELTNFVLLSGQNEISGSIVWQNNNDVLKYELDNDLDPLTSYNIIFNTKISIMLSGEWVEVFSKAYNASFTTKSESSSLVLTEDDIAYSYPMPRQYCFLLDEYEKGYLKPKADFWWTDDPDVGLYARFTNSVGDSYNVIANFNQGMLQYDFPNDQLEVNQIYKAEYFYQIGSEQTVFYTFYFKTSQYRTFIEKVNRFTQNSFYYNHIPYNGVYVLTASYRDENTDLPQNEFWDHYEILKEEYFSLNNVQTYKSKGLVRVETLLDNNWYASLNQHLYTPLIEHPEVLKWRDNRDITGPIKAAGYISQDNSIAKLLTDEEIGSYTPEGFDGYFSFKLNHFQSLIAYRDYTDVMSHLNTLMSEGTENSSPFSYYVNNPCPSIMANDNALKVKLNYVLPGIGETTSSTDELAFSQD